MQWYSKQPTLWKVKYQIGFQTTGWDFVPQDPQAAKGFTFLWLKVLQENNAAKHDQSTKNFDVAIKTYTYTAAFFINTLSL